MVTLARCQGNKTMSAHGKNSHPTTYPSLGHTCCCIYSRGRMTWLQMRHREFHDCRNARLECFLSKSLNLSMPRNVHTGVRGAYSKTNAPGLHLTLPSVSCSKRPTIDCGVLMVLAAEKNVSEQTLPFVCTQWKIAVVICVMMNKAAASRVVFWASEDFEEHRNPTYMLKNEFCYRATMPAVASNAERNSTSHSMLGNACR